jgi:hypothetical protein
MQRQYCRKEPTRTPTERSEACVGPASVQHLALSTHQPVHGNHHSMLVLPLNSTQMSGVTALVVGDHPYLRASDVTGNGFRLRAFEPHYHVHAQCVMGNMLQFIQGSLRAQVTHSYRQQQAVTEQQHQQYPVYLCHQLCDHTHAHSRSTALNLQWRWLQHS